MEMILMGMGGCSSVDVVSILQKSRQDIKDCHVERADAVPAVFTKIHLNFIVKAKVSKKLRLNVPLNYLLINTVLLR